MSKPNQLLVQKKLLRCQKVRQDAEIELENAADTFKRLKRKDVKSLEHIFQAYKYIQQLEKCLDDLAAVAIDYEVLFEHFYDQAKRTEKDEDD